MSTSAAVAALVALAAPVGAGAAIKPGGTTIDAVARVGPGGKTVELTGLITCTNCVSFRLGLTVTQGRTATLAQGGARCRCETPETRWVVNAKVLQGARLEAGSARVCAWAVTQQAGGAVDDVHQWCRTVRVVAQ